MGEQRQCVAITRKGRRCPSEPMEGGDYCEYHASPTHGSRWPSAADAYKRYAAQQQTSDDTEPR